MTHIHLLSVALLCVITLAPCAIAQGSHAGNTGTLNLTVPNTLPDNFGTYAADGLADDWQVQYFGLGNPRAAPLLDPDGDGHHNRFEFTTGLIPTDALSVFHWRIEAVTGSTTSDTGNERTVTDTSATGSAKFYSVEIVKP